MKNILTTFSFVLFILYSATGFAQRFPNLSFKSMSEIEGKDIFFMDTVHSVAKYRIALYKYYDLERRWPTSKRFAIVRDWIEDNRYIQVIPYEGSVDYVQSELFKFTGGAFSFCDSYEGYNIRMSVPDEDYSIGMADNLSMQKREIKFHLTKDKLTYTITTDQQGGCGFKFSDEWVEEGDGAARGDIPVQPIDPHKENIGCNGGTHRDTVLVHGLHGKGYNIIPYTYTCTHYIRQVPRSAGVRSGGYARATGEYNKRKIPAGQVYIGKAGEYGGDPFAPWQFTYTTTVTVSLPEMAKMNGMSLEELAYYMTSLSQSNNGFFLPTNKVAPNKINNICYDGTNYIHQIDENEKIIASTFGYRLGLTDLEVFYPSLGDILAYGFWKVFDLETYAKRMAKKCEIEGQEYEAVQNYDKARKAYHASYNYLENDNIFKKYEEMSYLNLMQMIADKSAKIEDLFNFLIKFDNDKPTIVYENAMGFKLMDFEHTNPEKEEKKSKYWDTIYSYYLDYKLKETKADTKP